MFLYEFPFTHMFHLVRRSLEFYPHNSLISNSCRRGFSMSHMGEDDFFSSNPISYCSYLCHYRAIVYTSLFTKFTQSSSLEGFSFFHSSLWQHVAPISMKYAEDFSLSLPLSYIYTTSTIIEPEKWSNFFLPDFECFLSFFCWFHEAHCRYFREKRKKFA